MALGHPGRTGKVQLALISSATPGAQHIAEFITAQDIGHVLTVEHNPYGGDYLMGNRRLTLRT